MENLGKSYFKSALIVFYTMFVSGLSAQYMNSNLLNGLPHGSINPAFTIDKDISISILGRAFSIGNENFTLGDVFTDREQIKVLDLAKLANVSGTNNLTRYHENFQSIEVAFRRGRNVFSFGHNWRLDGALVYQKGLVELLAFGNKPLVGSEVTFKPGISYNSYHETYVGYSGGNENFRFGGRIKILNGEQNLQTGRSAFTLATSNDIYQLQLDSDVEVFSSGVLDYQGSDSVEFSTQRLRFDNLLSSNWGWGLDLGLSTKLGQVELFMSGIDLGTVKWSEDSKLYAKKATTNYDGVDILDFLGEEVDFSLVDTLSSFLDLETDSINYSTSLSGEVYIGAKYALNEKWQFGAMLSRELTPVAKANAIMVNCNRKIGKYLEAGLSLTYRDKSITNLGGHIVGKYKFITLYATTHNFLAAMFPENFNTSSIRVGGTLDFNM